jgi:NADH-quinone oxidoreductase subunit M
VTIRCASPLRAFPIVATPQRARWLALVGACVGLLLTFPLIAHFDNHVGQMQFVELLAWLPVLDISYHLGIDGVSLWLTVLTAFTTLIIVIASWTAITVRVAQYLASFMLLSGLMVGAFTALDGMLFFVLFEATLIPMYLLIGVWGGSHRVPAALKFFFFAFIGSLAMLLAMLYLHRQSHTLFNRIGMEGAIVQMIS